MRKLGSISITVVMLMLAIGVGRLSAGSPDSPGDPNSIASQMFTLDQIYQRLSDGTTGTLITAFREPVTAPTSGTMHTLNEIMAKAPAADNTNGAVQANVFSGKTFWGLNASSGQWGLRTGTAPPAGVAKTGQTTCYDVSGNVIGCFPQLSEDGAQQRGVTAPSPRFVVAGPGPLEGTGTVTDRLTGLIWLRNANCFGQVSWGQAVNLVIQVNNNGSCGAPFNQSQGADWRLPNVRELHTLIDYGHVNPALPPGYDSVFTNFPTTTAIRYWSSTTVENTNQTANAWEIDFNIGTVNRNQPKTTLYYVWPVRGGQ